MVIADLRALIQVAQSASNAIFLLVGPGLIHRGGDAWNNVEARTTVAALSLGTGIDISLGRTFGLRVQLGDFYSTFRVKKPDGPSMKGQHEVLAALSLGNR